MIRKRLTVLVAAVALLGTGFVFGVPNAEAGYSRCGKGPNSCWATPGNCCERKSIGRYHRPTNRSTHWGPAYARY